MKLHLTVSGGLAMGGKILQKQALVKNFFQLSNFKDFVPVLAGCLVIRTVAQSPQLLADMEVMGVM